MNIAIIVAGGSGTRMLSDRPKQYLDLGGVPVVVRTLRIFDASDLIDRILLVVPDVDRAFCRDELLGVAGLKKPVELVAGGKTRQVSVWNGLKAARASDDDLVAIHDAVRPFLEPADLSACIAAAARTGACILALKAFDTLKQTGPDGHINATLDRESIWLAQTPQVFRYGLIYAAHRRARQNQIAGTDDAALLEMTGYPVGILPGSRLNLKITTPADLILAEAILNRLPETSSGM